uniref:GG24686 n=1 Tax=Drosophila erecta TaxID=7220 RepID=B3NZZ0_DROER
MQPSPLEDAIIRGMEVSIGHWALGIGESAMGNGRWAVGGGHGQEPSEHVGSRSNAGGQSAG